MAQEAISHAVRLFSYLLFLVFFYIFPSVSSLLFCYFIPSFLFLLFSTFLISYFHFIYSFISSFNFIYFRYLYLGEIGQGQQCRNINIKIEINVESKLKHSRYVCILCSTYRWLVCRFNCNHDFFLLVYICSIQYFNTLCCTVLPSFFTL